MPGGRRSKAVTKAEIDELETRIDTAIDILETAQESNSPSVMRAAISSALEVLEGEDEDDEAFQDEDEEDDDEDDEDEEDNEEEEEQPAADG
jgi:hypothetical protein